MKIILDTNFLLLPAQFKIDIFEELKEFSQHIFTFDVCIDELEGIAKSGGRKSVQARVALDLLKKKRIKIIKTGEKNADIAILKYVKTIKKDGDLSVATNDRKLIKTLKNNGINIIRLRQKKYLVSE